MRSRSVMSSLRISLPEPCLSWCESGMDTAVLLSLRDGGDRSVFSRALLPNPLALHLSGDHFVLPSVRGLDGLDLRPAAEGASPRREVRHRGMAETILSAALPRWRTARAWLSRSCHSAEKTTLAPSRGRQSPAPTPAPD